MWRAAIMPQRFGVLSSLYSILAKWINQIQNNNVQTEMIYRFVQWPRVVCTIIVHLWLVLRALKNFAQFTTYAALFPTGRSFQTEWTCEEFVASEAAAPTYPATRLPELSLSKSAYTLWCQVYRLRLGLGLVLRWLSCDYILFLHIR